MRYGKDLINKYIISMADGKLLGRVKDLYLDPKSTSIMGIFLHKEGLLRKKYFFIKRESVHVFGLDAILVKNSDVILEKTQYAPASEWVLLDDLRGRAMDTPGGTKVGKVGDIIVNEEAHIIGLTLTKIVVEGTIASKQMISRAAIIDMGELDGVITIDIEKAETLELAPYISPLLSESNDDA